LDAFLAKYSKVEIGGEGEGGPLALLAYTITKAARGTEPRMI
jgi:hypothetical protein